MPTESPTPRSQEPSTYPSRQPDQSSPHPYLKIHFNIILPSSPRSSKRSLPPRFPTKTLYASLSFPHMCYTPRPSHASWFASVTFNESKPTDLHTYPPTDTTIRTSVQPHVLQNTSHHTTPHHMPAWDALLHNYEDNDSAPDRLLSLHNKRYAHNNTLCSRTFMISPRNCI